MGEKVVIIGDASVGKSSLVYRYMHNAWTDNLKPTIGCDHCEKDVTVNGQTVKLSIWDTAGLERFRGLSNSYYGKAKCIVIVYDISRRASFEKVEFWREEIANFADSNPVKILVGTKLDLQDKRAVLRDEGMNYANKHKLSFFIEVSALDNQGNGVQVLFDKVAELVLEMMHANAGSKTDLPRPVRLPEDGGAKPEGEEGCKC